MNDLVKKMLEDYLEVAPVTGTEVTNDGVIVWYTDDSNCSKDVVIKDFELEDVLHYAIEWDAPE